MIAMIAMHPGRRLTQHRELVLPADQRRLTRAARPRLAGSFTCPEGQPRLTCPDGQALAQRRGRERRRDRAAIGARRRVERE